MEQLIKAGSVVPAFRLPDATGRVVERQRFRGRANLLLLFLPDLGPDALRYLQQLDQAAAGWARDEQALVIVQASIEQLAPLAPGLRFPLLADVEGQVRARFLPQQAAGGWFATDRWGELYAQGLVGHSRQLPPPEELQGWLTFIACECR